MKLLLLVVLFATGTSLNAQEEIMDKTLLRKRAMLYKAAAGKDTVRQSEIVVVPGQRVRILPQDGMPCMVPDTRDIAAMPNAWSRAKEATRPVPGQIPNAWQPLKEKALAK